MKKKKHAFLGFSIMELIVSFMVVAILAGVTTPIMLKKSSKMKLKSFNSLTTSCENCSENLKTNCQLFKKSIVNGTATYTCAVCKAKAVKDCKNKGEGHYFDKTNCTCGSCSEFNSKVSPACTNCCIRCNSEYCTGCTLGVGLQDRTKETHMGCKVCQKGYYSDNSNGVDEKCKKCPEGYYCPEDRQTDGKKYKCPIGYYCPEGTKDYKDYPCPAGYYCPDEGMTTGTKYPCPAGCACPGKMGGLSENLSLTEVGRTLKCPKKIDDNQPYPCAKNYYCPQGTVSTTENSCDSWRRFSVTKFKGAAGTSYCECDKGYYLLGGSCSRCADGTYKAHIGNDTYCTDCPVGQYCPSTTEEPKKCACGTYSEGKATSCGICSAGQYSGEKATGCSTCTGNTISVAKACVCTNCLPTQTTDAGHIKCINCNDLWTGCIACDQNRCTRCKCGYMLKNGKCEQCLAGTYAKEGATSCSTCASNKISTAGACECTDCDSTKYTDDHKTCKKCSDKWGSACTKCTENTCTACKSGWTTSLNRGKTSKHCCRHPKEADCSGVLGTSSKGTKMCISTSNRGSGNTLIEQLKPNKSQTTSGSDVCWGITNVTSSSSDDLDLYTAKPDKCTYGADAHGTSADYKYKNTSGTMVANNYSACFRTVCRRLAAKTICEYSAKEHLMTYNEINGLNFSKLRLCDRDSNTHGYPQCATNTNNCPSSSSARCAPSVLFYAETLDNNNTAGSVSSCLLKNGSLERSSSAEGVAGSVRCAKDWYCQNSELGMNQE